LANSLVDAVVAPLVGIGQGRARALLDADVVQLGSVSIDGHVDVAQAALLADVREHHAGELVPALEVLGAMIAMVFVDDTLELIARQQLQELGKNVGLAWHGGASGGLETVKRPPYRMSASIGCCPGNHGASTTPPPTICPAQRKGENSIPKKPEPIFHHAIHSLMNQSAKVNRTTGQQ
jgi:hypothetical protein